jgi:hypothetical protein
VFDSECNGKYAFNWSVVLLRSGQGMVGVDTTMVKQMKMDGLKI